MRINFKIFTSFLTTLFVAGGLSVNTHCAGSFPSDNLVENTFLLLLLDEGVKISSSSPAAGSVGIALNTSITLTFNKPMDTGSVVLQQADGTCSGSVRVSGDSFSTCVGGTITADSAATTFTITPTANLALDRNYSVRVTTDAQSSTGQKLNADSTFSFRTGSSIAINPTSVAVPISNTFTFAASGGQTPYTYSVVTGGGGTINSVTGAYTAPAAAAGPITIRVTDGNGVVSDSSVTVHTYNSVVQADSGLAGYWRLNETAGTVATDQSGNGNNGTYNGGFTSVPGAITADADTAVSFDGTTQFVNGITAPFDPAATDFTAEVWFFANNLVKNQTTLLLGQAGAGGQPWLLIDTNVTDLLATNLGGTGTGVTVPAVNQWNHVVLTKSGTTIRIYLNGALRATNIVNTASSTGTLYIGGINGATSLNGSMDEVALYSRALSAEDVALHYRLGKNKYLHLIPDNAELRWNVNRQLTPLGGTPPYTYSVTSGPGSVNANTGLYSSATTNGTANVQVTDARGNTDTVSMPVAFSPLNLGNLRLWLRADSITSSPEGANLTSWSDGSGFGVNFTHTLSATQPTWNSSGLNGRPTVSFDGTAWLTTFAGSLNLTGDMTLIMVARPQGGVNNRTLFGRFKLGEVAADNVLFELNTDAGGNLRWYHEYGNGTDEFVLSPSTLAVGNWYYLGGVRQSTANTINFLFNGAANSVGYTNDATGGGDGLQRLFIGSQLTNNIFQGDIAEILVFNTALTNPNLQNVCNYLNTRYALAITCP